MLFEHYKSFRPISPFVIGIVLASYLLIPVSGTAQLIQNKTISRAFLLDTHGYATGQLSRIERENMHNLTINRAYIGQLLLGNDSESSTTNVGLPLELDNNPWSFCIDEDDFDAIEDFIGKDVIVEFKTPRSSMFLSCSAIAEMISISLVTDENHHDETYLESNMPVLGMDAAYGVELGRITNTIKNKNISREYYLTLQVGGRGNRFSHFVITDHDLYDFAVTNLKVGTIVKVHYKKRLNSQQSRNRFLVKGIEIVDPDSR